MSSLAILSQAAMLAVVGPNGPVLEPVPPAPVEEFVTVEEGKPERDCVNRWRLIHAGAQIADFSSTLYATREGGRTESNPVIKGLCGKKPNALCLAGFKAASFGLVEWQSSRSKTAKGACTVHKFAAIITGAAATVNMTIALK